MPYPLFFLLSPSPEQVALLPCGLSFFGHGSHIFLGSIPSTETQPKKDSPPASIPTSDSTGQTTDMPTVVEPVVSPRGRDHAKSFYKYSDYKEVIEKMKQGG